MIQSRAKKSKGFFCLLRNFLQTKRKDLKDKKIKKFGNLLCMNDCRNYLTLSFKKSKPEMVAVLAVLEDNNDNEYYFLYSTKKEKLEKVIHDFGLTKVSIGDTLVVIESQENSSKQSI